jgi:hypothetical protein
MPEPEGAFKVVQNTSTPQFHLCGGQNSLTFLLICCWHLSLLLLRLLSVTAAAAAAGE